MKKCFKSLFLSFLVFFGMNQIAQAQIFRISISIVDHYGYGVSDSTHISFRNSDSITTPSNPYIKSMYGGSFFNSYGDSSNFSSNYTDSNITILYKACGQWQTKDTFFHSYVYSGSSYYYLNMTIHAPCVNPCNAGFNLSVNFNGLKITTIPTSYFGPFKHYWDFGDGSDSSGKNILHYYAQPGTYTVLHTILDTLNACTDTHSYSLSLLPTCNAYFYGGFKKYGHFQIYNAGNNNPGFVHKWRIGDSTILGHPNGFEYQFGAAGGKPIWHIIEYPGYCIDSISRTFIQTPCSTEIDHYQVQFRNLQIFPENNTDTFRYQFGNGASMIAKGPISYNYSYNGAFSVQIRDLHGYCAAKTLNISIYYDCATHFSQHVIAPYKLELRMNNPSNYTTRRVFLNGDTLLGDTIIYTFSNPGNNTFYNQLIDTNNTVVCSKIGNAYMNSCGEFDSYYDGISGVIRFTNFDYRSYDSLIVYLIEHNQSAGTLTAIDSMKKSLPDSTFFSFKGYCDTSKRYLVKAALLPGSRIYANYLPTYSKASATWSNAGEFANDTFLYIDMILGTNPGGPGFIGGLISQGANKKFKPLSGIQVNLFNDQGNPVTYTYSDANGAYSFDNIAYGKYQVIVEELGKTSASYWVSIDANNPKSEERNFEVNSTYVSLLSTGILKQELSAGIYPNPCNDFLIIDWLDEVQEQTELSFYGLDGKLLKSMTIIKDGEQTQIDVSELPKGLMLLRIIRNKGLSSHLIQKS